MEANLHFSEDGSRFGQVTCEHPTRLHEQFIHGEHNRHHELLSTTDLGNGWTRVTMRLQYNESD